MQLRQTRSRGHRAARVRLRSLDSSKSRKSRPRPWFTTQTTLSRQGRAARASPSSRLHRVLALVDHVPEPGLRGRAARAARRRRRPRASPDSGALGLRREVDDDLLHAARRAPRRSASRSSISCDVDRAARSPSSSGAAPGCERSVSKPDPGDHARSMQYCASRRATTDLPTPPFSPPTQWTRPMRSPSVDVGRRLASRSRAAHRRTCPPTVAGTGGALRAGIGHMNGCARIGTSVPVPAHSDRSLAARATGENAPRRREA